MSGEPGRRPDGYTLVAIVVFMAVLAISILVVVPAVSKVMQREKEEELIFRGKQYANAILAFQRRQGRPPLQLAELMKTKPRSARKLFKEPVCNCDNWGLIRMGDIWPRPRPGQNGLAGTSGATGGPGIFGGSGPFGGSGSIWGQPASTTTTSAGPSGSTGGSGGSGVAGFGNDQLFKDQSEQVNNRPIIGVYSRVHRKGLRTFKGMEYYDDWGFIAGQNNDDTPFMFPTFQNRAPPPAQR